MQAVGLVRQRDAMAAIPLVAKVMLVAIVEEPPAPKAPLPNTRNDSHSERGQTVA